MREALNKEIIEGLTSSGNVEFLESINNLVYSLISTTVTEISQKSPFIKVENCVLTPVNELYTGAVTQLSQYSYFLGVDNREIVFKSRVTKNWLKAFWREFKASWRLGRKKKYKDKPQTLSTATAEKYKLSDFKNDLILKISDHLSKTSVIYDNGSYITLVGKDDFGSGVRINIYVCLFNAQSKEYTLQKSSGNLFTVQFGKRYDNLSKKAKAVGSGFGNMVKVFNSIYSKSYNRIPNQILMESLLFNCPDELYKKGDLYSTFVDVANFIKFSSASSVPSICDESKSIFEEELIVDGATQNDFARIVGMLEKFRF